GVPLHPGEVHPAAGADQLRRRDRGDGTGPVDGCGGPVDPAHPAGLPDLPASLRARHDRECPEVTPRAPSPLQQLRESLPELNPTMRAVAETLLADPLLAGTLSITQVARDAGASAASVSRQIGRAHV